jgi:hypothetical protein
MQTPRPTTAALHPDQPYSVPRLHCIDDLREQADFPHRLQTVHLNLYPRLGTEPFLSRKVAQRFMLGTLLHLLDTPTTANTLEFSVQPFIFMTLTFSCGTSDSSRQSHSKRPVLRVPFCSGVVDGLVRVMSAGTCRRLLMPDKVPLSSHRTTGQSSPEPPRLCGFERSPTGTVSDRYHNSSNLSSEPSTWDCGPASLFFPKLFVWTFSSACAW